MHKGDDLQRHYTMFNPLCVGHRKKMCTRGLFCAEFVLGQSFVKALISDKKVKKENSWMDRGSS